MVKKKSNKKPLEGQKRVWYRYLKSNFGPKGYYRNLNKNNIKFYLHDKYSTKYTLRPFNEIEGDYVYTDVKLKRHINDKKNKERKPKPQFYINTSKGKAFILKGRKIIDRGIDRKYIYDSQSNIIKTKNLNADNNYYVLYDKKNNKRQRIGKWKGISQKKNVNKIINKKPIFRFIKDIMKSNKMYEGIYSKFGLNKDTKDDIKKALKADLIKLIMGSKLISKYKKHKKTTLGDLLISSHILMGGIGGTPMNIEELNDYVRLDKTYEKPKKRILKEMQYLPAVYSA